MAKVVKDPYVVSLHKRILLPLLGLSFLLYLGAVVPLRLVLWSTGMSMHTPRVQQWYWTINTTIPLLINIILRFVWYAPLDRCYLAVLSSLDEPLAADLRKRAPRSGWDMAKTEVKRWMNVVLFLPIYWFLSLIPVVGRGCKFLFKVRGGRVVVGMGSNRPGREREDEQEWIYTSHSFTDVARRRRGAEEAYIQLL